jgi:hypothetical protein
MIQRRMTAAGIATQAGNHSFRATGITARFALEGGHEGCHISAGGGSGHPS